MSKSSETPAQKIKRLERQLANAETKNMIYGDMVEILKNEYGIDLEKSTWPSAVASQRTRESKGGIGL